MQLATWMMDPVTPGVYQMQTANPSATSYSGPSQMFYFAGTEVPQQLQAGSSPPCGGKLWI